MHLRTRVVPALVGLMLVLSACGGSTHQWRAASSGAPASAPASSAAAAVPCPESSAPASPAAASDLKIGVVTDIGTLNDKNYNEYSFKGAQRAPRPSAPPTPQSIVPKRLVGVRVRPSSRSSTRATT